MRFRGQRWRQPHGGVVHLAPKWRYLVRHGPNPHRSDLAALLARPPLLNIDRCREEPATS